MTDSPTGRRVVPFAQLKAQEDASWLVMKRMRKAAIAAGGVETFPDAFDFTGVDYAEIELRIMAAMRDDAL